MYVVPKGTPDRELYFLHKELFIQGTKNMATKSIPKDVKAKVVDIIDRVNRDVLADDY